MKRIKSFKDAREILAGYVPPRGSLAHAYTLDRMQALMTKLGNPQNSLKVIHVAGTSGKTSTSYYIAALLESAGLKVGLTVSPHIDEVNERVQINLKPLKEAVFCNELAGFLDIVEATGIKPTYFELLIAFAYYEFAKQKVDFAVVEVGLGGLLDGTNVINRSDKICVITDLDLDHTRILGNTVTEIATQKAGIIQTHNAVFTYKHNDDIMSVISGTVSEKQARLHELTMPELGLLPPDLPIFQKRNWFLAQTVVQYALQREGVRLPSDSDWQATAQTYIPARMEIIENNKKTLVLDGAHNAQKMETLVTSLADRFPNIKFSVLLALSTSKDSNKFEILQALEPITGHIIFTTFRVSQDLPHQSVPADSLAATARQLGFKDVEVINDSWAAYETFLKRPEEVQLITGSFYLLNHVRPLIFK